MRNREISTGSSSKPEKGKSYDALRPDKKGKKSEGKSDTTSEARFYGSLSDTQQRRMNEAGRAAQTATESRFNRSLNDTQREALNNAGRAAQTATENRFNRSLNPTQREALNNAGRAARDVRDAARDARNNRDSGYGSGSGW